MKISLTKINILLGSIIALIVIIAAISLFHTAKETEIKVEVNDRIDVTPTIITAMKEIGKWEFLSITDEELVDTVRKGFFSDDELARIYYGKMSLGINMHKTSPHWIRQKGDSIVLTLPPIELLDKDFIDEARTKAFIESGKWSDADREAMYRLAYGKMLRRCMTESNINTAKENARLQFGKMLKAMNINKYEITWEK